MSDLETIQALKDCKMPFKTIFERFVETISENETQRVIDMIFQRPELIDSANNGNSNSSFLRIKFLHQCLVYFVFEQMERQVCIWHARIRTQIQTLFLHCSWEEPIPTGRPSWVQWFHFGKPAPKNTMSKSFWHCWPTNLPAIAFEERTISDALHLLNGRQAASYPITIILPLP